MDMPAKKYILRLTAQEREEFEAVVRKGRSAARKIQRSQVMLSIDSSELGLCWTDERASEAYRCTRRSVEMWRKQAVEQGPLSLLARQAPLARPGKLSGEPEARLTALACSSPPDGRSRWTLRLLANRLVELEVVDSVSHETVRQELKKMISSHGAR
jgi:homeodomain-containing protein